MRGKSPRFSSPDGSALNGTLEIKPPPPFYFGISAKPTLWPLHRARPTCDYGRCVQSATRRTTPRAKGRTLSANRKTNMTYIEQFEQELVKKLQGTEDPAAIGSVE